MLMLNTDSPDRAESAGSDKSVFNLNSSSGILPMSLEIISPFNSYQGSCPPYSLTTSKLVVCKVIQYGAPLRQLSRNGY